MKTLAILAGLAIGTPLYAEPHPDDAPMSEESARGWADLTSDVQIAGSRQTLTITHAGDISQLRIASSSGRPYIDKIVVRYRSGEKAIYHVHRSLHVPGDTVDVPLREGPHGIDQVVVYTPGQHKGSYSILGE